MKNKNRHDGRRQNPNGQNGNTQRGPANQQGQRSAPPAMHRHNPDKGLVHVPIPKAFVQQVHKKEEAEDTANGAKRHELHSLAGAFHSMSQMLAILHPDGMYSLLTGVVPTDEELHKAVKDHQPRVRRARVRLRPESLRGETEHFAVVTIYKLPSGIWFTTTVLDGPGKESRPTMNMPMVRACNNASWLGILSKWTGMHWDINSQRRYHEYRRLPLGVYTALFDTIEEEREIIRTKLAENHRLTFEELIEHAANRGGHSVVDPTFHDDEDLSIEAVDPDSVHAGTYAEAQ